MKRLSTLVPSLFAAASLQAQATTPKDTTVQLERVTITATRSSQPAFLVPLALTTVGPEDLHQSSGVGIDQALKLVPGVLAQSRTGGTDVRIVIRGYGARGAGDRSNSGTSRGIRVLLDGFPETEPDGRTAFDAIDLSLAEHMDVVRSNASALWGNAAGGLVSLSTIPQFTNSRLMVEPMAGSFGLRRIALSAGSRLGDEGRAWLDHTNTVQEGWRVNSSGRRQLLNGGVTTPVGRSTALTVHATATNNLLHVPGPLTWAEYLADPQQANPGYLTRRERRHNRTGRLGVSLDHERDDTGVDVSLYVNPKYLQRSERNTFRDFTRYHIGGSAMAHTRHDVGSRSATFSVGGDAAFQSGAVLFYNLVNGERGTTLRDNKAEGAANLGIFVQEELPLTDRLSVTLGARYDEIAYDYKDFMAPKLDDQKSFTGVSPKIGLSYVFGPSHTVYANVGGGVEAPAGNETNPASTVGLDTVTALNPLLDPIRSITYELGTRRAGTIGSGYVWSYDAAVYNTEVRNEIVPYQGGRFYFTAGRARRQGAELGLRLQSSAGVGARSAITWSRHRYVTYVVDSVHYNRPGAFADYAGNKLVGVPDLTVGSELFFQPPAVPGLRFELGAMHTGEYFADDANRYPVPSHTVFDAGMSYAREVRGRGTIRARLAVENLTDKRFVASAFLNPDRNAAGQPMALEPGLPRTVVLGLTLTRAR